MKTKFTLNFPPLSGYFAAPSLFGLLLDVLNVCGDVAELFLKTLQIAVFWFSAVN